VRKTPSWPRSWANFSLLWLNAHRNARAKFRLLGQPDTLLAEVDERAEQMRQFALPESTIFIFLLSTRAGTPPSARAGFIV
jgi:hypothetical protein